MGDVYINLGFHHSLRMTKLYALKCAQVRSGALRPSSSQLDVANFRQVENRRSYAFGVFIRPFAVNFQAFDALGATQNVAVFYEPALADVSAVNAHDKPLLKIERAN